MITSVLFLALDLLGSLLLFNPDRRISAEDALDHTFLAEYRCPDDEPIALRSFHVENEVSPSKMDQSDFFLSTLYHTTHVHVVYFSGFMTNNNSQNQTVIPYFSIFFPIKKYIHVFIIITVT